MADAAGQGYGERWWGPDTVAVVTGANKGIGFHIACILAEQGLCVLATARDVSRGEEAASKLREAAAAAGNGGNVVFRKLDVASQASVDAFAEWLRREKPGGVTVVVNNAGLAYKGDIFGADEAENTINTNFYGVARVCEALQGQLAPNARIVNVSSMAGSLAIVKDPKRRAQFESVQDKAGIQQLASQFVAAIRAGRHREEGWPNTMYGVSKLCCSSYSRVLAKQLEPQGVMVNACCPGWCQTDMSSMSGNKSAAQGADTPVWLALRAPNDFATGGFYQERQQLPF